MGHSRSMGLRGVTARRRYVRGLTAGFASCAARLHLLRHTNDTTQPTDPNSTATEAPGGSIRAGSPATKRSITPLWSMRRSDYNLGHSQPQTA